jgi:hypothetical protein
MACGSTFLNTDKSQKLARLSSIRPTVALALQRRGAGAMLLLDFVNQAARESVQEVQQETA